MDEIHAGGHAKKEDIKLLLKQTKPKYIMPVYANHYLLQEAKNLVTHEGWPEKNVFVLDNGQILQFDQKGPKLLKERIRTNYVFVDGLGIGDVGEVVLRDRQALAKDGMFVIVIAVDRTVGKVKGSPDIISRGFVYLRESKELLKETRKRVIGIVNKAVGSGGAVNWTYVKNELRNKIGEFLFNKTQRRPMVLPVVIEV
jgi:ribonuclease J